MEVQMSWSEEFEHLVQSALRELAIEVIPINWQSNQKGYQPDFKMKIGSIEAFCEVKFYKSSNVNFEYIKRAATILAGYDSHLIFYRVLIVSSYVSKAYKDEVNAHLGVIIWDRSNLSNFLAAKGTSDHLEKFGQLIMEAQQGIDIELPYENIDEDTDTDPTNYFSRKSNLQPIQIEKEGEELVRKLNRTAVGKAGWSDYERNCELALKHLFRNDLAVWARQQITDDDLSRFDLICRISSGDDFWRTLVHSFQSRYILFEFKNYKEELPQAQIYTTERYLYPKALRGVCIIIARNGASLQAQNAAKGALREQGKLILVIDNSDLEKMLLLSDAGNSPSDYMAEKLDAFLMSLSR